jgi:hypothetical protein
MDLLLRRNCAWLNAQSSGRHHMQTPPPHAPCSRGHPQQLQQNSSLEHRRSLCVVAAGNVQATPVLKSGGKQLALLAKQAFDSLHMTRLLEACLPLEAAQPSACLASSICVPHTALRALHFSGIESVLSIRIMWALSCRCRACGNEGQRVTADQQQSAAVVDHSCTFS